MFYTSDFLIGTSFMTNEQIGKYIKLLCYQHQLGHLTKDNMIKLCGEEDREVFSKFIIDDDNKYYNERLEKEIIKREKFIDHQQENGSKGGRPKNPTVNPNKTQIKPKSKPKQKPLEDDNDNINDNIIVIENKDIYYSNIELNKTFLEYLNVRKSIKLDISKSIIERLQRKLDNYDDEIKIEMLENAIIGKWKNIYELDKKKMVSKNRELPDELLERYR